MSALFHLYLCGRKAAEEDLGYALPDYAKKTGLKRLDLEPDLALHTKEHLDLRDLVADEVEYKKLDPTVVDKAVRYIRDSNRLMEMLDLVVEEAISRCAQ